MKSHINGSGTRCFRVVVAWPRYRTHISALCMENTRLRERKRHHTPDPNANCLCYGIQRSSSCMEKARPRELKKYQAPAPSEKQFGRVWPITRHKMSSLKYYIFSLWQYKLRLVSIVPYHCHLLPTWFIVCSS